MIKQPLLAGISAVLLLVFLWFVADRLQFLYCAETSLGTVFEVTGQNDTCGSRKQRYSCTKFTAEVQFADKQKQWHRMSMSAGSCRGSNRPISNASYSVGASVEVAYDPSRPTRAYPNTFWGIWGTPLIVFAFQVSSFFASLFDKRT